MSVYLAVLFVHVAAAMTTFVGIGAWFVTIVGLRRAQRGEEATILTPIFQVGGAVGVAGIAILALAGLYLALTTWGLQVGWIQVAIGAFALPAPVGPLIVAPRIERMLREARMSADGPFSPAMLARLHDPVPKLGLHIIFGDLVGIVFLMTTKPSFIGSIIAIVVFIAVSLGLALPPVGKVVWASVERFASLEESSPIYRWLGGGR